MRASTGRPAFWNLPDLGVGLKGSDAARCQQQQREIQGCDLNESLVERADLVVSPTAGPHGGYVGAAEPDSPGDPIKRQLPRGNERR